MTDSVELGLLSVCGKHETAFGTTTQNHDSKARQNPVKGLG